jgi:metallo-beta-lactamase family protein
MKAKVKFLGGVADHLTGSCYLLVVSEGKKISKILIDAGLIQGSFKDSVLNNKEILKQIKPSEIDYIILTHSHIDHIGRLPLFTKNGFKGRIMCTKSTKDLLGVMLEDSAKIQMAEAAYFNKKLLKAEKEGESQKGNCRDSSTLGNYDRIKRKKADQKNKDCCEPLYTFDDVLLLNPLIKNDGYDYHDWIRLTHTIALKFYPSGHVIGGAIVVLRIDSKPKDVYLCFTGDLGRRDGIILPPPEVVSEPVDYLFLESTYGGRVHPDRDQEISKLLDLVRLGAQRNKRIIIPSFALERSQEIIYLLSYYMEQGLVPEVPIYLDSPLGSKITSTFSDGWLTGMFSDQSRLKFNPFDPAKNPYLHIVSKQADSDSLISKTNKYIVIAGSGMCDAGRVRGHLRENLPKNDTIVCLVGYMAENSLGRKLKDGAAVVKMNGQEIEVKAEVISFDSFSAHADGPFLVDYSKAVLTSNKINPQTIFLVHGEGVSAKALKKDLEINLPEVEVMIPEINEEYIIK